MSLVRSATRYGNRKLYSLNGTNDTSGLSTAVYNPEKHRIIYDTDSSSTESYNDPKYLLDSPTEELTRTSTSSIRAQGAPSYQLLAAQDTFNSSVVVMRDCGAYQPSFEPEYLESLGSEGVDYDEDSMRLKLQELERALLDDENDDADEDDAMFGPTRGMEIDSGEWAPHHRIHDVQLHDSPKESTTSSDSYVSSISSNKEESLNTPKDVLFGCAAAISDGNIEEASTMINELRQRVSIQGEPAQRIAAYMVEALAARMATSGKGLYKALKCKEPPSLDRLSAMQVLFEVCPCFRFGFMAANGAIIDAFKNEKMVHIIDFDINQGSQYITLLQTLASRPGKPPFLRLTGVDDPESVQRPVGGLNLIGQRLDQLAKALELPFEFQAVGAKTEAVSPAMLDCRPGEAILVNFAFQLHHMPDESVSTVNQRDHLLRMVKSLNPKLVTVVEQDVNTNTAPFLPRFVEAYNYYTAVFESLDATLPRDSQDRLNVEKQCLARDIVNIVACEGEERIERYEVAGKWRARMMMAGFDSCPISPSVNGSIRELIKKYSDRYKVREETGAMHFGWEDRVLIVASAWR